LETLKEKISEAPISRGRNWKLPFHISIDASDTALGVVLGKNDLTPYTIYYTNKNLTPAELNYTLQKRSFYLLYIPSINSNITSLVMKPSYTEIILQLDIMNKPITNG